MKTFLATTIAFCLFFLASSAQTNTFPTSGSVGIGTTTPVNLLHVFGSGATALTIERNTTLSNISAEFKNGTASWFAGQAGTNGNFGIATSNNLQSSTLFNITTAGNVGIGTNAPANKLHIIDVTGTNTLNLQLSTNTLGETIGIAFGTQPGNRTKAAITGVNTNSGNAGGALAFYTNAGASLNEAMRITSTGNVGIGTASPNANMESLAATEQMRLSYDATHYTSLTTTSAGNLNVVPVGGNVVFNGLAIISSAGTFSSPTGLTNSGGSANAYLNTATTGTTISRNVADASPAAIVSQLNASSTGDILDLRNSGGTVFNVTRAGNVGIGTINPDAKLAVQGTIHSTSVFVDTNVPTPDYVFKDGYRLPTLAEVKAYTDKNHHLPEVPAAAEFEKNGINLGEMNMLLLKKVEELTLYLIEKDKQIKELQKQTARFQLQNEHINEMEKKLNDLNNKMRTTKIFHK